jgi:uncharacterized tellurite resistance protein B-like protein
MGLISSLFGSNDTLNERDAVAAIMLIAVIADGPHTKQEEELFVAVSNSMKLFKDQNAEEFNEMISKIRGLIDGHGKEAVLADAAKIVPEDLRATTYALCVDLVFADGTVRRQETAMLEAIQNALSVPEELADTIDDVLRIKNRG